MEYLYKYLPQDRSFYSGFSIGVIAGCVVLYTSQQSSIQRLSNDIQQTKSVVQQILERQDQLQTILTQQAQKLQATIAPPAQLKRNASAVYFDAQEEEGEVVADSNEATGQSKSDLDAKIEKADEIFANSFSDTITYLEELIQSYPREREVLWRIARAHRQYAMNTKTLSKDRKQYHVETGLKYAKQAITVDESYWMSHKWYAICLSGQLDFLTQKEQLANSFVIEEHFKKAIKLNPNEKQDPALFHALGVWCWTFADMSWVVRRMAKSFIGDVPDPSYQDALDYFETAEKIQPGFYLKNVLMIAKVQQRLKMNNESVATLEKLLAYKANNLEDEQAQQEGRQLLAR